MNNNLTTLLAIIGIIFILSLFGSTLFYIGIGIIIGILIRRHNSKGKY
ncbi:MAG: hypothetical protein ACOCP8_01775 [archaeon]